MLIELSRRAPIMALASAALVSAGQKESTLLSPWMDIGVLIEMVMEGVGGSKSEAGLGS